MAISRDDAEGIYGQFFPLFRQALIQARRDMDESFVSVRPSLTGGTIAGIMHNLTVMHLRRLFADAPGMYFSQRRGLFLLHYSDLAIIRVKKFTRHMRTRSIPTSQTRMFNNPLLPMAGMPAEAERFVLGYRNDDSGMAFAGMYFARPDGSGCEWWIEMDDGNGLAGQIMPAMPQASPAPSTPIRKKVVGVERKEEASVDGARDEGVSG